MRYKFLTITDRYSIEVSIIEKCYETELSSKIDYSHKEVMDENKNRNLTSINPEFKS